MIEQEIKLTPKEKQRIYNRNYQKKVRHNKGLKSFGCLLTEEEHKAISSHIKEGQSIKDFIMSLVINKDKKNQWAC